MLHSSHANLCPSIDIALIYIYQGKIVCECIIDFTDLCNLFIHDYFG